MAVPGLPAELRAAPLVRYQRSADPLALQRPGGAVSMAFGTVLTRKRQISRALLTFTARRPEDFARSSSFSV